MVFIDFMVWGFYYVACFFSVIFFCNVVLFYLMFKESVVFNVGGKIGSIGFMGRRILWVIYRVFKGYFD